MWCGADISRQRLRSDGDCTAYGEEYHILVVGAPGVGKTAICKTYMAGREDGGWSRMAMHTDGTTVQSAEFCTWDKVDEQNCCIRLSMQPISYEVTVEEIENEPHFLQTQVADGFLLIYSVTDRDSFDATSNYYRMIMTTRNYTDTPLVISGHKSDATTLSRHISISEGRDAAFDLGASFYESSVMSNPEEVKFLFHDVIRQVRAVRTQLRAQEQTCTRVRGFINRLSLKSKRRRSRSRSRRNLVASQQTL